MWVRWADEAKAGMEGESARIDLADLTVLIPGGAAVLAGLREILQEPKLLEEVEQELLSLNIPRAKETLGELINEQVLTPWELTPELISIHQQTVAGGESPALSPALETGRLLRETGGGQGILLPHGEHGGMPLRLALSSRRTCRAFRARTLTAEELGSILSLAASAGGSAPPGSKIPGGPPAQRPYPSGGGLYPIELLVYAADVAGIAERFYYYQALAHRLVPFAPKPERHLETQLAGHAVGEAAFFVLLFLDFTRLSLSKYGRKAYRLALLEAGHLAQNVLLAASSVGLAALPLCGFDDEGLSRTAGLCYPEQPVLYVLAVGSAGGDAKWPGDDAR